MKRIIILLFFIALAVSTYAYSKGAPAFNVNYELIKTPIAGVVYTPDSLGYHHLPINITYSGTVVLSSLLLDIKDITWIKSMILGKDNLKNATINILSNETYEDTSWIPNITCNKSQKMGILNQSNCTDYGYYYNFTNWRYVWNPLESVSIKKDKWFAIDIVGYSPPTLGHSAVDIVPSLYSFTMPELAWWSANYLNCKNITLTETVGINRTFEPMKVNLTGLTKLANNNDVRIVNAACNADGTEQPRDVISSNSNWAYVIFLPNYTTTDSSHIYSVYYNYAGASAPSYSGTLALTGNTTQYNVSVTNQYKMVYVNNFRDGAVKFTYYNDGTTLQQWGQFDDFNSASTQTLTTILNGTVMNSFYSNSSYKNEIYECYDNNFYCKIQYLQNPAANYFTVCPETNAAPIYWSAGAWAVGSVGNKNTIAIAWNNSNAKLVAQMNITGWTTEGCIRSDGSNWYTSTTDLCTYGGNSSRAFYLLFNLPYASNSTFDKLLNPMTTALGAEQSGSGGTSPTLIREWLNNAENNLSLAYGYSNLNITSTINVTGLPVSILKNGTILATTTSRAETTSNGLGVGYYNFTGNYSGNATYAASSQSYFLTVSQQPTSCSLSFSPTSNASYETQMKAICSCNNTAGSLNLYRNTTQINSLNNTLVTYGAGTYVYICNMTSTQNYSSDTSGGTFVVSKLNAALQAYPNTGFNYTGINTNQYCTGSSTISSLSFYRNSSSITNNTGFVLPARGWNYTCNLADAINYTNYYSVNLFNVSKAAANASVNFNTSSPAVIGAVINVSCYIPEPPATYPDGLWNLSTNISNPYIWNTAGYAVGTYPFKCNQSGSENYSAFSTNSSMTLTATGALVITAVYDEENMSKFLTFNVEIFNSTYSVTSSGITNYNNNDVKGGLTIIISATGYGTRTYYATVPPTGSYTMSGYLLNVSSGTNKVFYVKNYYEKYLIDVLFNITKLAGGNWTTMAMGITNDLGYSVFFLNSNGNYKFTLTKATYDTKNITLVPIYDSYTIYMTTPTINVNPTTYNASYGNITYGLWLDKSTTNNSIRFNYNDMMNQTTNVSFRIYNSTNHSIYWTWNASNPTNFSKELPKPNTTYLAVINITHNIYGRINIVRSFDTSSTILPKPFSEDLFNQVMSVIAIIMVAMMFGAVEGATGGIIVMIVATIFVYWGWYSVSTIIMGIAWFYAILNKFMHRKVVK